MGKHNRLENATLLELRSLRSTLGSVLTPMPRCAARRRVPASCNDTSPTPVPLQQPDLHLPKPFCSWHSRCKSPLGAFFCDLDGDLMVVGFAQSWSRTSC